MRVARVMVALLLTATASYAADPVYIDELVETPLASLQQHFPKLRHEGCYQLFADRYLLVTMDKKDAKPWRVVMSNVAPCRRPEPGPQMDVRLRAGVELGNSSVEVVSRLGRPDASSAPEPALRRLGEVEYFYVCRVSEGCARHTSVFIKDGAVTALSEWYSE